MKPLTTHLMLVALKTDFLERVPPYLQRKFFREHNNIDMSDCGTLIRDIAAKQHVTEEIALELANDKMGEEADIIMDFLLKEKIVRLAAQAPVPDLGDCN